MLPIPPSVDLGVMAMNGYSTFPKAPELLESNYQIFLCHIQDIHWGVLPLCSDIVYVFYSPCRLDNIYLYNQYKFK